MQPPTEKIVENERPTTTVHIRIPHEDRDVIRQMADDDQRSFINMVQVILHKAVIAHKEQQQ